MPDDVTNPPSSSSSPYISGEIETPPSQPRQRKRVSWIVIAVTVFIVLTLATGLLYFFLDNLLTRGIASNNEQTSNLLQESVRQVQPTETPLRLESPISPLFTPTTTSPIPFPAATKVADTANLIAQAHTAFQRALAEQDRGQFETVLDSLAQIESVAPTSSSQLASLRSQVLFALDTLDGTVYLDDQNTTHWSLNTTGGGTLHFPIDLTINDTGVYIIDSGTLYRADWPAATNGGALSLTPVLTPEARINGFPVKEIVAVEATNTDDIFVLDKANDIYRYRSISDSWSLETPVANQYDSPDPLYLNLSSYADRLYILDPARNQIWRHPPNETGPGFLPGTLPWLIKPGEPDVNSGIDLTIDGNIYVLQRDGVVVAYSPSETVRFNLVGADNLSRVLGWAELPTQPVAVHATVDGSFLHVADKGRRRIVIFNRNNGDILRQLVAPDNLDFVSVRSIVERDDYLYILAGDHLYGYDLTNLDSFLSLTGELPALATISSAAMSLNDLFPNDPRLPYVLAKYDFQMPLREALLPDRSAIYPGSRRAYRYGVHQGLDLYGKDIGIDVELGTPVYAAADGVIIQADADYREMALDEVSSLLANANYLHFTPSETLAKLNGRQVWIDHGGGLATRYSHLSGIAEGIVTGQAVVAGQLIGYVGLSGTPDGIVGNTQFPHLHFEIRFGPDYRYYVGQWLSIEDTRRVFEYIFDVPIRPAYLEFR